MTRAFSAPGKCLLAGGYLVLDPTYNAYVTALSSRMHALARAGEPCPENTITITSPQFVEGEWLYIVEDEKWIGGAREVNQRHNPFIEATISTVLSYVQPKLKFNFDITIYSDPGYHSQDCGTWKKSLTQEKQFLFHDLPITEVAKTGMGSSAGLVVVVTTALLSYFIEDVQNRETLIHNLSQIAHCLAQQKIGSGFDVAAAVFGSITYKRFDPKIIDQLLKHEVFTHENTPELQADYSHLLKQIASSPWKFNHHQNSLPPHLKLLMGDISGGSNTPKLVAKVLKWKQENPQQSSELYASLDQANEDFIRAIEHINMQAKANSATYNKALAIFSTYSYQDLRENTKPVLQTASIYLDPMLRLMTAMFDIRKNLQLLTKYTGAEIEPPSQTELLDHCLTLKGCLGGVVPGAGGYDAIALLVIENNLEQLLTTTKNDERFKNVTWLQLHEEAKGLKVENPNDYVGL